jgi:uncharacterized Rmd1/YagE family protein
MASRKQKKDKFLSNESSGRNAIPIHHSAEAMSDSEAAYNNRGPYYQFASSLPNNRSVYSPLGHGIDNGNYTDDDRDLRANEFGDGLGAGNKLVKSGRQRKKLAARTKGGEFQTKRRKRRIYFCCISSEIDVQKLSDYLHGADDLLFDWKFEVYSDVLHMYKPEPNSVPISAPNNNSRTDNATDVNYGSSADGISLENYLKTKREKQPGNSAPITNTNPFSSKPSFRERDHNIDLLDEPGILRADSIPTEEKSRLLGVGTREVFVFDFGAVVFWGFPRDEEAGLLKTIRMFVTKGMVGSSEFQSGEDDMAFVSSPDEKSIVIANDVVTLPDETEPKQRLAVSFAIAQSSVLAIFEARIEDKVDEYKYIPETLAAVGKVHLSERQLGMMIGEVFVIRHDVNLHTEILGMQNCRT